MAVNRITSKCKLPPCSGGRPACRRRRHPAASPRPHFSRTTRKPSQSSGIVRSFPSTGRDARLYGSQDARCYADGGRTDALLHRPPPCSGGRPACRSWRHPAASPCPHFYRKTHNNSIRPGLYAAFLPPGGTPGSTAGKMPAATEPKVIGKTPPPLPVAPAEQQSSPHSPASWCRKSSSGSDQASFAGGTHDRNRR